MSDIQEEQKRLYKRAEENDKEQEINNKFARIVRDKMKDISAVEMIVLQDEEINKQKEVLDKIKEYCKSKIEEQKNMTDFSKYYLENYDKAISETHSSHSGVLLETIKSTTIKRYEDILELLEEIE